MEDGELKSPSSEKPVSFAEAFDKAFPTYLLLGMSPSQYWDEDASLVRFYREADILRRRRENVQMWTQGRYVYEAMSSALSALFAKSKSDIYPYPEEPFPITKEEVEELERRRYEAQRERMIASFMGKAKIHEGGQTDE